MDGNGQPIVLNLRFPGQYYDSETNLYYNYFRYYDPSVVRYITSDPIGLVGGMNTYAYVLNKPLSWIDPYGLWGWFGAAYGAIAGGVGGYISGGWKGAGVGMFAGALVGLVNPFGANWAGASAGAGVGSYAGQAAGNWVAGKDVTKPDNYNHCAAARAAVGGAVGGPLGNLASKYVRPIMSSPVNKPLHALGPNYIPGNISGAISEGALVGSGEALGAKFK